MSRVSEAAESHADAALAALGREIPLSRFRRIESGRRLWNFSTREMGLWRTVL